MSDRPDDPTQSVILPGLWVGDIAEIHGPGAGDLAGTVVRIVSDRGRLWTTETTDGTPVKVNPTALRPTDTPFVTTVPVGLPGEVVTLNPPAPGYTAEQLFVVIAEQVATLTVAKLGGDRALPYRVPRRCCRLADIPT